MFFSLLLQLSQINGKKYPIENAHEIVRKCIKFRWNIEKVREHRNRIMNHQNTDKSSRCD